MSPRRFTLVLGGGGMKGLAHIGALAALEERTLVPAEIVGSSIGALVGAAWCAGTAAAELEELALQVTRRDLFRVAHRKMALQRMRSPGLYHRRPLFNVIRGLLGDVTFAELKRPLLVNTVDLAAGRQVIWGRPGYDDVPVAEAVYASCALPGYLPPQRIRGRHYADGAPVANLPLGAAAELGREFVLAVDVGTTVEVRDDIHEIGFAAVYARSIEIAMQTMRDMTLRHWDRPPLMLVQPAVEHYSMFTFTHNRELIDEGYRAAAAVLDVPDALPPPDGRGVFPKGVVRRPSSEAHVPG